MNKVILMGRLTKEPVGKTESYAKFTLAVDRRKDETDFISCVAFGKLGDFVLKYLTTGTKIALSGRIQTGSYEKDGRKIFTTDVVAEDIEFAESKKQPPTAPDNLVSENDFMVIDTEETNLPFK